MSLPAIYQWSKPADGGVFKRQVSSFRNWIGTSPFLPEKNRYHFPWAHRTLLVRNLKGLQDSIGISIVHYDMGKDENTPGCIPDSVNNASFVRDLYFKANSEYAGRFTVPILWDKKSSTIVNNESSEIIRMLNSDALNPLMDFYPEKFATDIDAINSWIYDEINNGVYKTGFATTQSAYDSAVTTLFTALDRVESHLQDRKYLVGNVFTEADIRLFTTLVRFDPVYHTHFKCNMKTLAEYPRILEWLRRIYQIEKVSETVNMDHIKKHYYLSHIQINPFRIVPANNGPVLDTPRIDP